MKLQKQSANSIELDIRSLTKGIYIIDFRTNNDTSTFKLIEQ
jgi:hypothetical protein